MSEPPARRCRSPRSASVAWFYVVAGFGACYVLVLQRLTSVALVRQAGCNLPPTAPDAPSDRAARYLKYYRTYRYVAPASREDTTTKVMTLRWDPARECGAAPDYAPWFKQGKRERSRSGEDQFVYEALFKARPDVRGTYLELGAYDGRQESNTRFFDECLGWEGLLIEGNPKSYVQVVAHRPFAHRMSLAPSCSAAEEAANGTIPFYRYAITNSGLVGHARDYEGKPTVAVPCGPLTPVLADVFADRATPGGLPTLDFFSLDVEGSEDLVLATLDFRAVRVNVLLIESHNNWCMRGCEVRRQVRARMANEGYRRYTEMVKNSDLYVHPQSPFQIPKSRAKPDDNRTSTKVE